MKKVAHIWEFLLYLVMNLKNNYLLKKTVEVGQPIKSIRILIFTYNVVFEKKEKHLEKPLFTPVYQNSSWYDLQFLRYRVWQTEIGNYGSFFDFFSHTP